MPKKGKDTETTPTRAHQSSRFTDGLEFNPASTLDSVLEQGKRDRLAQRHSVILLSRGSRRISNVMDEYGSMSIQRGKDLYEAQSLAIPFSNDFYKPVWDTGDPERHAQLRK